MLLFLTIVTTVLAQSAPNEASEQRCAAVLRASARELESMSATIAADADYAEAHGGAFSPEMTQRFVSWYQRVRNRNPDLYPELSRTDLSTAEREQLEAAAAEFVEEGKQQFYRRKDELTAKAVAACPWRADELRTKFGGTERR